MLYYTHILFAIFLGGFFGNGLYYYLLLVFFSLIMDVDEKRSIFGRKVKVLHYIFGHRKFFHSLLFIILGYLILSLFSELLGIAFLIATGSHLILDALTPMGVMPFYPLKFKINGWIKTGGFTEKVIVVVLVIGLILKTIHL